MSLKNMEFVGETSNFDQMIYNNNVDNKNVENVKLD